MAHSRHNDDRIDRIEISLKNTQDGIRKLFLHSTKHELQIEALNQKIDRYQQENRERFEKMDQRFEKMDQRFEKIEDTLAIIVNHLQK